ncbi:acetyl-CoA hydrolase/transferase family protein [Niveispirillum cyanobacteriorum]|uniref:Acetyl-CoA hydrolase n=1 Tax=Niveispirillum cyanobacteriorum TaxID=1612173 RepID=A0A2K9NDL8_9PROT|nr:acetyl-CoA hydrolase/transferase C-terminal domain-containing protein [Niveispirillum cyanobacteriorum]AUN31179.1 acetyl-CoA hydrolase [Niveispirillum cyanobacteriorum]GGE86690.1 acetyl-CoA hydrolase [Niveispirillum cyanobacteriorum]
MQKITLAEAPAWIAAKAGRGGRVYVAGCSGQPTALFDAFRTRPDKAAGLIFHGIWIPGVNPLDWAGLHPAARGEATFASPDWQDSAAAGRLRIVPETYTASYVRLERAAADVAVAMVAPPDHKGDCSLGLAADFTPAAWMRACHRMLLINPQMPVPIDGPCLKLADADAVVEADHPLLTVGPVTLDSAFAAIAGHIRTLLRDGDTLQFGLGKVQLAMLANLSGLRDIRLHAGMVSDPLLPLLSQDVLADGPGAVTTGVALGSPALYDAVASDPRVRFRPVGYTHDIRTLAAIPRLIAINSVIEVDLFGQANAEFIGEKAVSGGGGLLDFLRGSRMSPGGLPIIALVSTARSGVLSRIVPRLMAPAITIPRCDVGLVVTEQGLADLRGLDEDARAMALISIADPAHRDSLSSAWKQMRRQ